MVGFAKIRDKLTRAVMGVLHEEAIEFSDNRLQLAIVALMAVLRDGVNSPVSVATSKVIVAAYRTANPEIVEAACALEEGSEALATQRAGAIYAENVREHAERAVAAALRGAQGGNAEEVIKREVYQQVISAYSLVGYGVPVETVKQCGLPAPLFALAGVVPPAHVTNLRGEDAKRLFVVSLAECERRVERAKKKK